MLNTEKSAPDPAAVNPTMSDDRRAFIKAHFQHYGVWNEAGWESLLSKAEERLCELLYLAEYEQTSQVSFLFEADKFAWDKHVKACGLDAVQHSWPFPKGPSKTDVRPGISTLYRDWRVARGLPIEKPSAKKASTKSASQKQQAPGESSSSKPVPPKQASSSSAPRGPSNVSPAPPRQAASVTASRKPSNPKPAPSGQSSSGPASRRPSNVSPAPLKQASSSSAPRGPSNPKPAPSGQSSGSASRGPSKLNPAPSKQAPSTLASRKQRSSRPAVAEEVGESSAARERSSQMEGVRSLLGDIRLEEDAEERAIAKEIARKAAIKDAMSKAANAIFDAEMARIEAKNASKPQAAQAGSATDEEDVVDPPIVPAGTTVPLRHGYGAHIRVEAQPPKVAERRLREIIWEALRMEAPSGPITGCFEIAIPPWVDFYDLFLGERGSLFREIASEGLLPRGISISWISDKDRPVKFVVGPDPNLGHSSDNTNLHLQMRSVWYKMVEWSMDVYQGSPQRLTDFLRVKHRLELDLDFAVRIDTTAEFKYVWDMVNSDQARAFRIAKETKENLVKWTPEVHAILQQPSLSVGVMLQDWVMRDGVDRIHRRRNIARDVWSLVDPTAAWLWDQQMLGLLQ
ncbi:hypothetical protein FAVG1_00319 [Fusarium avenaceum]|nr:hypothetical protein FAVG1_00319 [Fusarium avenaceum]